MTSLRRTLLQTHLPLPFPPSPPLPKLQPERLPLVLINSLSSLDAQGDPGPYPSTRHAKEDCITSTAAVHLREK